MTFDGGVFSALANPARGEPAPVNLDAGFEADDVDFNEDRAQALLIDPTGTKVRVLDAKSSALLATYSLTTQRFPVVTYAAFIGDGVYAVTESRSGQGRAEWFVRGTKKTEVHWFTDFDCVGGSARPRARVSGDLWAVASMHPHRLDLIDVSKPKRVWSAPLPSMDWALGREDRTHRRLMLGSTVCSTTPAWVSPLVKTPSGLLVYVSSRGLAVIDPAKRTSRVILYERCPND